MTPQVRGQELPQRAAGYVRISNDPHGLERGVTRQIEDIHERANQLGWTVSTIYTENDTSAYKKRRIVLPDGRVVWRVVRPEFRQMLDDFYGGKIDGIIVWDQDRLLRQPRDLEDLIDLVEVNHRPVTGITSTIDLMTSGGRAMARVMAAMALKSSEDTARRVSRAQLADARDGKVKNFRRFGRNEDGSINEKQAAVLRWAAKRINSGESWAGTVAIIERGQVPDLGDVRPLNGGRWSMQVLRYALFNPMVAGIAVYKGEGVREQFAGKSAVERLIASALKNPDGTYIKTDLPEIISVEDWQAVTANFTSRYDETEFTGRGAKKYLLSGLLRCGKVREDGTVCNRPLVGTRLKDRQHPGESFVVYRCPGIALGGCGGTQRRADHLEKLVEDLLFAYLTERAPSEPAAAQDAVEVSEDQRKLDAAIQRLAKLREEYASGEGSVSDETFFSTVPLLEANIRKLAKAVKDETAARPQYAPLHTADEVRAEWDEADLAGMRGILGQYLHAIVVKPVKRGRRTFDHNSIDPKWKQTASA
jgi:DNA invertase Pin-like site-specific DNA recombinase